MAIIILGKTDCGICGRPIERTSDATSFPAFLPPEHKLARFSDDAFHTACFDACPERPLVEAAYEKYRQIWESRPRGLRSLEEIEAWGKEAFRNL